MSNIPAFNIVGAQLSAIESSLVQVIEAALVTGSPARDRKKCDDIFGIFSHQYLLPCIQNGLASRASNFAMGTLIPKVLAIEARLATEFHKGALFHDTAAAAWLGGDDDGFEYLLAMTDEEELKTTGGSHVRGAFNLRAGGLANHSLQKRLQFACDLLNGVLYSNPVNFAFLTGSPPITPSRFDAWRQRLDAVHQFELLRVVQDVEVYSGFKFPAYPQVLDNPFILLRLAKALSHLAQLVESCLTRWQGGGSGALSQKLITDSDFGAPLVTAAGNQGRFAGNSPHGPAVDASLRLLLADLKAAPAGVERHWRLLRILYIARNSTAHVIDPTLTYYSDRALLLEVIQGVFVSLFTICQLKRQPMP